MIALKDVLPGTRIIVDVSEAGHYVPIGTGVRTITATLVKHTSLSLLAWADRPDGSHSWYINRPDARPDAETAAHMRAYGCDYGWWETHNLLCRLAIFLPDQKCGSCGISLAHKEFKDGEAIVCLPCKVFDALEG